ncbi:MAG: hypothetical protein LLG04_04560 [Parachlamydia sp.]|nr:hypothetical protein [Parachlamydia sp.]
MKTKNAIQIQESRQNIGKTQKPKAKKEELRKAYLATNDDEGQREATQEWQSTLGDGPIESKQSKSFSAIINLDN